MENNTNNQITQNNENNENNRTNENNLNVQKAQDFASKFKEFKSTKKGQFIIAIIFIVVFVPIYVMIKMNSTSKHSSYRPLKPTTEMLQTKVLPVLKKECDKANSIKSQTKVECAGVSVGKDDLSITLKYKLLPSSQVKLSDIDPKEIKKSICSDKKMLGMILQIDYLEFIYLNADESDKVVARIEKCK